MWLLLEALVNDNARVKKLVNLNHNCDMEIPSEMPPKGDLKDIDCLAVLEWHDLVIILNGRGDYVYKPVNDVRCAMKTWNPDYIICAIQNRDIISNTGNNIWDNFDKNFPNTRYERVSFWSEFAEEGFEKVVKRPTIEAIMKYMA